MNRAGGGGSQKQIRLCQWENYFPSPGFEPRTAQPVASQHTDYAFTPHPQFTFCNVPFFFLPEILWHICSGEKKNHGGRRFTADDWYQRTQNCISWQRKSCNVARTIRKISRTAVHLNVDGSYHSWRQIKQNTCTTVSLLPNPDIQHKITMFNKFRTILFFLYGVKKGISRYR